MASNDYRSGEFVHRTDLMHALAAYKFRGQRTPNNGGRPSKPVTGGRWQYRDGEPNEPREDTREYPSQNRLADLTGLTSAMVSRYVNGKAGEWIELSRADLLLTAAGLQYRFLIDVPIYTWVNGENKGTDMAAAVTSTGTEQYWCENCVAERSESEVVFYVDLGRMCLTCRSGKVQPLELAQMNGLAREPG